MRDKDKVIAWCEALLEDLRSVEDGDVQLQIGERRDIVNESGLELKIVNGAMCTVGEPPVMGRSYEIRLAIWDKGSKTPINYTFSRG